MNGDAIAISAADERSDDFCHVEVDTSEQQGFVSDSDVSSRFPPGSARPAECVFVLHAPVGFRVSRNSHKSVSQPFVTCYPKSHLDIGSLIPPSSVTHGQQRFSQNAPFRLHTKLEYK